MNSMEQKEFGTQKVMEAIRGGKVHMRPRWHFLLLSLFGVLGSFLVLLSLLYIASLTVFLMHRNGAWFGPSFGGRGWLTLLHGLPWLLFIAVALVAIVLGILVKRYSFVYRKPGVFTLGGILALVITGGIVVARTPIHHDIYSFAHRGVLPAPLDMMYRVPMHKPGSDVYRGIIAATTSKGFVLVDEDGQGTTSIIVTPRTRLPYGADFFEGEIVVVIGDQEGTDTVQAYGVREVEDD